ncbi:hypothetical protein GIY30_02580 [Gordonia sp. HNM0687]|uniref:Uncharacterized protein n=1 Tax=Gordonia mangrovi TaxID=2665643 RepID=A0A6L7GJZ0_9ACTN|nr:hypothetical protein [Gordonia mangrovi]MXP20250.1 hypothetical protein [Gordonia mangrovi]UVF79142.1 hypothetical protein NWF22_04645 [Gordonia mangrovi]
MILAMTTSIALAWAAVGKVVALSGLTLAPSLLSCLLLLFIGNTIDEKVLVLSLGWTTGNVVTLMVFLWNTKPESTTRQHAARSSSEEWSSGLGWYFARSATGYGAGAALQSAAAGLPPSQLTAIGVVQRVNSGFATMVTNTILPRYVNRNDNNMSRKAVYRYCTAVGLVSMMAGLTFAGVAVAAGWSDWARIVCLGCAWCAAATVNAAVQRVTLRDLPPAAFRWSVIGSICVATLVVFLATSGSLNLTYLLVCYVALEIFIASALSVEMRKFSLAFTNAVPVIVLSATGVLI